MPKKCGNCGGIISKDEEEDVRFCDYCRLPYHDDCYPDYCTRCKKSI